MTARRRLADHLAARWPTAGDDRGSLAMAMMAVLVAAMLGALILPTVIAQNKATRFDVTRVHALHAAQSGANIVLGQIRDSTVTDADGIVFGNPGNLPCYTKGKDAPLTGAANGTGNGSYSVTVDYWATTPTSDGTPMICSSGYGTFDPLTNTATPRYAVVTSRGTDGTVDSGSKGRTVVSTYVFQTDDTNIPGGQFRIFPDASGDAWCMDAGSAQPAAGASVVLRACSLSNPPTAQQVFSYRSDLSIQLVSSVSKAAPAGLCLDSEPTAHTTTPVPSIRLKLCGVANPAKCPDVTNCSPSNQQWSVDDSAHLRGALSDRSNVDGYCINVAAQASGTPLVLTGCAGGTKDTKQTWVPFPTAGAGMAGAANKQLVNYRQFATCLDVTGGDPGGGYLILYTCKQNPNPDKVLWNQKFTPAPALAAAPTDVLLRTTKDLTTYCLTSPLSRGGYVRVTAPCPISALGAYRWTVYQTQDASRNDLPYSKKYTIVDANGLCLGPGLNNDMHDGTYLKAIVTTCDGSTGQKWNATASLDASRIINTYEEQ